MKIRLLNLLFFFFVSAGLANAQTVDEVVVKHVNAMGGADKWAKAKSIRMTGSMELGPNMKAPFTITIKDRKKMRFEMEFQGMKMIQAFDGDSGWSVVPFSGKTDPERMSEEEVRGMKEQADFTGDLYDYKVKESLVEVMGKEDMEGTETIKLKVTKKNGDVKYIYLDGQSYITLKETSKQKFDDKEIETVNLLSDFRSVDGLMFPFTMEGRSDEESGMGQSMIMEKIEINPTIDNSVFMMPSSGTK